MGEVAEVLVAPLGGAGRIELDEEQLLISITAKPKRCQVHRGLAEADPRLRHNATLTGVPGKHRSRFALLPTVPLGCC